MSTKAYTLQQFKDLQHGDLFIFEHEANTASFLLMKNQSIQQIAKEIPYIMVFSKTGAKTYKSEYCYSSHQNKILTQRVITGTVHPNLWVYKTICESRS